MRCADSYTDLITTMVSATNRHMKSDIQSKETSSPKALTARPSPRQVGREKRAKALRWVYSWGWSSPSVLACVANDNGNGLAARLVRQGLLKRTRTESGGGHKNVPASILTLTAAGIIEVERDLRRAEDLLPYELDAHRVQQALLRHDTLAQLTTAKALQAGSITGYLTERELRRRSANGVKQPDVVWVSPHGLWAIEIELSAKWGKDLDHFVLACIDSLEQGSNGAPARFAFVCVVSDAPAILERYKRAFSEGAPVGVWRRDASRHWVKTCARKVPGWAQKRLLWKKID